ncbi:Uncharacterised protein [uncultured archaeon]|nr:Uncharacterised protein [uncultured archaeon]
MHEELIAATRRVKELANHSVAEDHAWFQREKFEPSTDERYGESRYTRENSTGSVASERVMVSRTPKVPFPSPDYVAGRFISRRATLHLRGHPFISTVSLVPGAEHDYEQLMMMAHNAFDTPDKSVELTQFPTIDAEGYRTVVKKDDTPPRPLFVPAPDHCVIEKDGKTVGVIYTVNVGGGVLTFNFHPDHAENLIRLLFTHGLPHQPPLELPAPKKTT